MGWQKSSSRISFPRRVGLVHASANVVALYLYVSSSLARKRGRRLRGWWLSTAGFGVATTSAYLGGHLSLGKGIGVDQTAFDEGPTDWQPVIADAKAEIFEGLEPEGVAIIPEDSPYRDRLVKEIQRILVEELVGLLVEQQRVRVPHGDAPGPFLAAERLAEHVADRNRADLRTGHAGNLEHREAAAAALQFDLYFLVVELACAQLAAEAVARRDPRPGPHQRVEHALFRG